MFTLAFAGLEDAVGALFVWLWLLGRVMRVYFVQGDPPGADAVAARGATATSSSQ